VWPDLASSHYAHLTLQTFDELAINIVQKESNPPVVPSLRHIEDFWGLLKTTVFKKNWKANDHDQLKRRIKYCLSQIDKEAVMAMMNNVFSKVKDGEKNGINSTFH